MPGEVIPHQAAEPVVGGMTLEEAALVSAELAERAHESLGRAESIAVNSVAENTRKTYAAGDARYRAYCEGYGLRAYPADPRVVAMFLADLHDGRIVGSNGKPLKGSSIAVNLTAVAYYNVMAGGAPGLAKDPGIVKLMAGIRRERMTAGEKPLRPRPIMLADLTAILAAMPYGDLDGHVAARRDHFALLAAWGAGLRRSELCLRVHGDISPLPGVGLLLDIPYSKTDQEGEGVRLVLRYHQDARLCAPCAYVRWAQLVQIHLEHVPDVDASKRARDAARATEHGVMDGYADAQPTEWGGTWVHVCTGIPHLPDDLPVMLPVSRRGAISTARDEDGAVRALGGDAFNGMVQRRCEAAGIEYKPSVKGSLPVSAHGLRSGFVTQALEAGASYDAIIEVTRHKTVDMVRVYDGRAVKGTTAQDAVWGA